MCNHRGITYSCTFLFQTVQLCFVKTLLFGCLSLYLCPKIDNYMIIKMHDLNEITFEAMQD